MTVATQVTNGNGRINMPWDKLIGPLGTLLMGVMGAYLGIRIAIADIRADIKIERSERVSEVRRLDGRIDAVAGTRTSRAAEVVE